MLHIDPVPTEAIDDPSVRVLLDELERLGSPGTLLVRVLAHAPGYARALGDAMLESHYRGNVDHGLKEIMRVALARHAGDAYFAGLRSRSATEDGLTEERVEAGCGDFESDDSFSEAHRCALRYAHLMYREPAALDAAFYAEMKRHFSEAQIMEMGAFIALHYGMQVFMRTLDAAPGGIDESTAPACTETE